VRTTIRPAALLHGRLTVPGDKSIAHRALIIDALADGAAQLRNVPTAADVRSTIDCLRALGVAIECEDGAVEVHGAGRRGLVQPAAALDCGNSGTSMRLLAGVAAGQNFAVRLDGDESLRRRPMERIATPLRLMGADVTTAEGCAPITIAGGGLSGIDFSTPVPSAQVKSCVLLAGLGASGATVVREAFATRDHTERMLGAAGAEISGDASRGGVKLLPGGRLQPLSGAIPGDVSSAMYWVVAALLATSSDLVVAGVGCNPTRTAVLGLLREWGADIDLTPVGEWAGEPLADLRVAKHRGTALRGGTVSGAQAAAMIDELPLLALLGPSTRDGVRISGAGELRHKESDRIATTVAALRALGARVDERDDGLVVPGSQRLRGGTVDAAGDHRIALAAAAVANAADGDIVIEGAEAADVSYPTFCDELRRFSEAQ
jgi:3-phosphoshikimate 1-carboxyvinyltransferase